MDRSDLIFDLKINGVSEASGKRLVIRCDAAGELWVSIPPSAGRGSL